MNDYRTKLNQSIGQKNQLIKHLEQKNRNLAALEKRLPAIENAQALLQEIAQQTQNQLKLHIEDIVNTGLETCFPETYDVHVDFIPKRGKSECDIYLTDIQGNRVNPIEDNGGGLVDIVSFSLRLACWTISSTDNLIVLDEPFKFLSANLRPLAGELLADLSKKLNLQILMVTHDNEMIDIADKIFVVKKNKNDISEVKEA